MTKTKTKAVNRPSTTARKRAKRCFELSFLSLTDMDDPGDWRLVHGFADLGHGYPVAHAWLTDGREVFDPVANVFCPVEEYCDGRFMPVLTYDKKEACRWANRTWDSGPWNMDFFLYDSPMRQELDRVRRDWPPRQEPPCHTSSPSMTVRWRREPLVRDE